MKILFICNEYPPNPYGGIGSFTKQIAEHLASRKIEVFVIGYADVKLKTTEIINQVTIIWLPRPKYGKNKYLNVLKQLCDRYSFYKAVSKEVNERKITLIESYDYGAPLVMKPSNSKLIVRLHGSHTASNYFMNKKGSFLLRILEKRAINRADHILSVSKHIALLTRKVFKLNFEYEMIYNGIDPTVFRDLGVERDANKILLVGRMHPYKGFDRLFSCLNLLFSLNEKVNIEVICTVIPDYKTFLLSMVETKFHSRINFVGRVDNNKLVQYYNAASILVLPSLTEALAIIPLEAMACGTPVIMTNAFTGPEIITDGIDGVLVDTSDNVSFANAINSTLACISTNDDMRTNAKRKIKQKFEIQDIMQQNVSFYEHVVNG